MTDTNTQPREDGSSLEVLLVFYSENSHQARHHEEQRQSLTNAVILASGLLMAGMAFTASQAKPLLLLVAAFGFLASLRHQERTRLHVEGVHAVREELSRRFDTDILGLYDVANQKHRGRFPLLSERTAHVYYIWQGVHAAIIIVGVALGLCVVFGVMP